MLSLRQMRLLLMHRRFSTIIPLREIDTSDGCFSCDWDKLFQIGKPIVFRGLVKDWPAVSDRYRRWALLNNLKQRILESGNGRNCMVPIELGENFMDRNLQKSEVDLLSLLEYFDLSDGKDVPRIYLAQHGLDEIAVMKDDVSPPSICGTGKGHIYRTNIWFGGHKGTESPCHHDPFHNVLCQVVGSKQVTLVDPVHSYALYPALHTVQSNTSQVSFTRPDYTKHPLFNDTVLYRCVLEPGDAVFIPLRWWHHCISTSLSCSVNFWWL